MNRHNSEMLLSHKEWNISLSHPLAVQEMASTSKVGESLAQLPSALLKTTKLHTYSLISQSCGSNSMDKQDAWHDQELQVSFRPNTRIGKKCDPSDFDHGMIVGARGVVWVSQKLHDLMGFSHAQQCLEFTENGAKKTEEPSSDRVLWLKTPC